MIEYFQPSTITNHNKISKKNKNPTLIIILKSKHTYKQNQMFKIKIEYGMNFFWNCFEVLVKTFVVLYKFVL